MELQYTNISILDNVIADPTSYRKKVLAGEFSQVVTEHGTFNNIQLLGQDDVSQTMERLYRDYTVMYNFARRSPIGQVEPTFIHHDREMGDLLAILYLNTEFPDGAGTTVWEHIEEGFVAKNEQFKNTQDIGDFRPVANLRMKFNRMVIIPTDVYHARSFENNFGDKEDARLVQILFLKKKL